MNNRSAQQTLSSSYRPDLRSDHRPDHATCVICMHQREEGLYIFDHFICRQCEEEMVHTDAGDEKYAYFIERLRTVRCTENENV